MNAVDIIRAQGYISNQVRNNQFKTLSILEIRDWLEENGFDRHLAIECVATEIALITPDGLLMQVRTADNGQFGLWGGCLEPGETPIQGAIRELFEETHLKVSPESLEFVERNQHDHTYSNGNMGIFDVYRYILKLDFVPKITLDEESSGVHFLRSVDEMDNVILEQREFVSKFIK